MFISASVLRLVETPGRTGTLHSVFEGNTGWLISTVLTERTQEVEYLPSFPGSSSTLTVPCGRSYDAITSLMKCVSVCSILLSL